MTQQIQPLQPHTQILQESSIYNDNRGIDDVDAFVLFSVLGQKRTLTQLNINLSNVRLIQAIQTFAELLGHCPIRCLRLSRRDSPHDEAEKKEREHSLAKGIGVILERKLEILCLDHFGEYPADGMYKISHSSLRILSLFRVAMCWEVLAGGLKTNKTLVALRLSNIPIYIVSENRRVYPREPGINAVLQAIYENRDSTLAHLDISENYLIDSVLPSVIALLSRNLLVSLNLSNNRFTDDGVGNIAQALVQNRTLRTLGLRKSQDGSHQNYNQLMLLFNGKVQNHSLERVHTSNAIPFQDLLDRNAQEGKYRVSILRGTTVTIASLRANRVHPFRTSILTLLPTILGMAADERCDSGLFFEKNDQDVLEDIPEWIILRIDRFINTRFCQDHVSPPPVNNSTCIVS